ncbi:electron transfer flavoprotein subunit alpha/FixB family protein [candidate division KSB1 bacterium]|nr:MAG: electron transfer flavoprotein subunit alpha/FixB family protein [candidate division KSB1 bacterium]
MANVLVFCETKAGKIKPVTRELLSAAKKIAGSESVIAVLFNECADAANLGAFGANKVLVLSNPELANYSTEGYAQAAAQVIEAEKPSAILFAATSRGRDLAPRTAARAGGPLIADCTEMKIEGGALCALRPIYAGKVLMWCKVAGGCAVLTLRPKAFTAEECGGSAQVETRAVNIDSGKIRARVIEDRVQSGGAVDVTEADMIVAGGRGMKAPENFGLIEELAKALGASVGASRAVVDAGWRPHSEQVGQTGKVVSPTLYIAAGISGAIQHLAGMNTSRVIVAINKDADAPIFKVASYGIVGDAMEVLPALTEEVKKVKAEG